MNILFITDKNVNPILGGIERITYVLADGFQRLCGHRCFSAFTQRVDDTPSFFAEELLLTKGNERPELNRFVKKNGIDIIIAQGSAENVNSIIDRIRNAINDVPTCKLLFVFHNMPGFEYIRIDARVLLYCESPCLTLICVTSICLHISPPTKSFFLRRHLFQNMQNYQVFNQMIILRLSAMPLRSIRS